jgi:hypothetical protein
MNDSIGVFISYSRQTRFEAATLAQELSRVGCRCWIDFEGIAGGDVWRRSIEQGLQKTWLMVVVLTPESVQSQWVLYEVHSAIRFGHTVIPIMFRKCDIPRELEPYQYIDYTQGPDYDTLFRSILIAVARRLHQPLSPSPSTDHLTSVPRRYSNYCQEAPRAKWACFSKSGSNNWRLVMTAQARWSSLRAQAHRATLAGLPRCRRRV